MVNVSQRGAAVACVSKLNEQNCCTAIFLYWIAWAQLGGGTGDASPPFLKQWGYNMPCHPTFLSLGFVIYWFHTKLSPSPFTTKLRSFWIIIAFCLCKGA